MSFPSPLAQPPHAHAALIPPAPAQPRLPVPPRRGRSAPIWIVGVLVVLLVLLAAYLLSILGRVTLIAGAVLALIPLAGVLVAVHIIDRWEPEPLSLRLFAVGWGAIAAVVIALGVDLLVVLLVGSGSLPQWFAPVVQAPIVEELGKGIGILLLLLFARRAFDGPVDGIVYGALIGAGFAFTENILYFGSSLVEGGVAQTTVTFFVRGLLSPFAHVMFTAATGYLVGRAIRRGDGRVGTLGAWVRGLLIAIVLHAVWNGSAVWADFFALYLLLQVPLFILFILGIILLRREEARVTRAMLGEYAASGWFSPEEVFALATSAGRRRAVAWARTLPGDRSAAMRTYISEATQLAAARQRALSGRDRHAVADEQIYLQRTVAARHVVLAP